MFRCPMRCCTSFDPRPIRPREGGDDNPSDAPLSRRSFDPRPREGGDALRVPFDASLTRFDPRPREGGDPIDQPLRSRRLSFDPRPREGGDPRSWSKRPCHRSFDPRPREGGDSDAQRLEWGREVVSIHAPAKGATPLKPASQHPAIVFRSTPPRRGRRGRSF